MEGRKEEGVEEKAVGGGREDSVVKNEEVYERDMRKKEKAEGRKEGF